MATHTFTSCGGVVIHRGKVLLLYKNQNGSHVGWVLPKGTVEPKETLRETAIREVKEESGSTARIARYLGKTQYTFLSTKSETKGQTCQKIVHWYLMRTKSFFSTPQGEEFFEDSGFYKKHEAEYLLKFYDEKQIMRKAFAEYDKKMAERKMQHDKTFKLEAGPKTSRQ